MKVAISCDHAAFALKEAIRAHLEERGIQYHDFGIYAADEKRDYPYASLYACRAIQSGECDRGIVLCGTGVGVSMAANKLAGIRAACCSDSFSAKYTRAHNDANVLCMGERVVGAGLACQLADLFLDTPFEGGAPCPPGGTDRRPGAGRAGIVYAGALPLGNAPFPDKQRNGGNKT